METQVVVKIQNGDYYLLVDQRVDVILTTLNMEVLDSVSDEKDAYLNRHKDSEEQVVETIDLTS